MQPKGRKPEVLLFDIGGVIVRWTGIAELGKLTGLSTELVAEKFANSDICKQHERGLCGDDIFLCEMIEMLNLDFSQSEMKFHWNSWVGEPYEGIVDALKFLKQDYRIACLSNSNAMHWDHLNTYLDTLGLFDPCLASHQIHRAKPDLDCFEYAIKAIDVEPERVLFFDDTPKNVETARLLGMQAYQVNPAKGCLPALKKFGFIDG